MIYSLIIGGSILALIFLVLVIPYILVVSPKKETVSPWSLELLYYFIVILIPGLLPLIFETFFGSTKEKQDDILSTYRKMAREINFFTVCLVHFPGLLDLLVVHIPVVVRVIVAKIKSTVLIIGRFLYYLFRMIHSEECLMAGVYISSGVAVGYLAFGNAIAGGLAAAVLAYASREIISKRILKVIPMRNGR